MKEIKVKYNPEKRQKSFVMLPLSKSIALRAMTLNAVARYMGVSEARISCLPDSEDVEGMRRAIETLFSSDSPKEVYIGDGGAPIRFFTALAASIPGKSITVTASESLMRRPMEILINTLCLAGGDIECLDKAGYPPLHINGRKLSPPSLKIDAGVSSQYISALMMAAPAWDCDLHLHLEGITTVSRSYINMTAEIMRTFGCEVDITDDDITVKHGVILPPEIYTIEGDWSAASYFYETAILHPSKELSIGNLAPFTDNMQGDSVCAAIFSMLATETRYNMDGSAAIICNPMELASFIARGKTLILNMNNTPDIVPALVPALCLAGIKFSFSGIGHLRHKETDRIAALQTEMRKLGYIIEVNEGNMSWMGETATPETEIRIKTYNDHRMAMGFAPAAIRFSEIIIENPDVVAKSFPTYWKELKKIGFSIG